jgi:hypothetical protein
MAQTTYSGMITFELETRRETCSLPRVPSLAALQAFATGLHAYTVAQVENVDLVTSYWYEGDLPADAAGVNKDLTFRAVITLKLAEAVPDVHPYKQILVPAPRLSMFEQIEGVGTRVTATAGNAIAALYSTLTGQTWTFKHGALIGG